jgi:ribosomal subunit interface protein
MQVSIGGQHTGIQPELRTTITEHFEGLNAQHDDIIHARVALDKDTHYQQGTDEVRVTLWLPGKMLTAKKTATTSYDAVNAALGAVERELKGFRDQQRGVVKEPGPRIRGRILRVFRDRGYGFAETETYQEVYFHANSVHGIAFEALEVGMAMDPRDRGRREGATSLSDHPTPAVSSMTTRARSHPVSWRQG